MAEYCRQCSMELFGEDRCDLVSPQGQRAEVCAGCGLTIVDCNGTCLGDCGKHHGPLGIVGSDEVKYLLEDMEASLDEMFDGGKERKAEWE